MSRLACRCVVATVFGWLTILHPWRAEAQSIFTFAGGGIDDRRPANLAALYDPSGVAIDNAGDLYIVDRIQSRIRKVSAATGIIETVAGNGTTGFSGDGGQATLARLSVPASIALDTAGNLYISETWRIRRVDRESGTITTIAGDGTSTLHADGTPATKSGMRPTGIAVDDMGNVFLIDAANLRIRKIDRSGLIATVAGSGSRGSRGDGGPATLAEFDFDAYRTWDPAALAVGPAGELYVSDPYAHRIRLIADGIITAFAGSGNKGFSGDGHLATLASMDTPCGLAISAEGDVYVTDTWNLRIRRIEPDTGLITTVAGGGTWHEDGRAPLETYLELPTAVAITPNGHLYVAQRYRVRFVTPTGPVATIAGNGSLVMLDEPGLATSASVRRPSGLALGEQNDLFVAEQWVGRVRKISSATGMIETVEPTIQSPRGLALDPTGNLYIGAWCRVYRRDAVTGELTTIAGNGEPGFSGDGGPASAALLNGTQTLALDRSGNLFIGDSRNNRIRRISPSGGITTIAGTGVAGYSGDGGPATQAALDSPDGIALDPSDNLLIADSHSYRVRRVDAKTQIITTIAGTGQCPPTSPDGGAATLTPLCVVYGLTVDVEGNIFVTTSSSVPGQVRVRKIDGRTSLITTVAGGGVGGDLGAATAALLSSPDDIAISASGDLYIADGGADRVRIVPACSSVSAVVLRSPSDGASGLRSSVAFEWERTSGAMAYDLYLGKRNPPPNLVGTAASTVFTAGNLEPYTTYYWKVVAKGDPFCDPFLSAESEVWSFTTASSCGVPGDFVDPGK